MFRLQTITATALRFIGADGQALDLDVATLGGLSLEGRDLASGQRRPDVVTAAHDPIEAVEDIDGGWRVTQASGQVLTVTQARLSAHASPDPWRLEPRPWSAAEACDFPVHDYHAFLGDDDIRRRALWQLAVHGFVRLTGAPATPNRIETVVAAFGIVRETNYGRVFDVRTKVDAGNLADTALALAPHTDNPYRLTPPDIQVLHCLQSAGSGGQSLLVDGLAAVRDLDDDDRRVLATTLVRFAWADAKTHLETVGPVLALAANGTLDRIRYNPRSMQSTTTDDPAWRDALTRFGKHLAQGEACLTFDMQPGDMVLMDNRRALHGRTGFDATVDIARHLQGAYADMDGVYSSLRRLTEAHAEAGIAALEARFSDAPLSDFYGEDISIRDHVLQSAGHAVTRGLGAEMVAAALLHDIGWGLGGAHEQTAAEIVAPVLGARVASLIRNHVAAKRYLVAMRPDYAARLSVASKQTLAQQGGPMSEAECRAFEALPDFELCLELRYLDEAGKDVNVQVRRFADYKPLLKALAITHALAG